MNEGDISGEGWKYGVASRLHRGQRRWVRYERQNHQMKNSALDKASHFTSRRFLSNLSQLLTLPRSLPAEEATTCSWSSAACHRTQEVSQALSVLSTRYLRSWFRYTAKTFNSLRRPFCYNSKKEGRQSIRWIRHTKRWTDCFHISVMWLKTL